MTASPGGREPDPDLVDAAEAAASPLDLLLTDAALGALRRFLPSTSTLRFAAGLARRPVTVTRRGASLAGQLASITAGRSAVAPGRRDRRFADPAWTQNPLLTRAMQAYLASAGTAEALLADVVQREVRR